MKVPIVLAGLACLILGIVIMQLYKTNSSENVLSIQDTKVYFDLADTPAKQVRGLSGRRYLASDHGMFFPYAQEFFPTFWMKDMHFPIDIIWIGSDFRIVDIAANVSPDTFPQKFSPQLPTQYVLEVNANFAAQNNIQVGDLVVLE